VSVLMDVRCDIFLGPIVMCSEFSRCHINLASFSRYVFAGLGGLTC
jgi:hypothetical protein